MNEPTSAIPGFALLDTREAFHAALRDAFAALAVDGCREVTVCDEDFADWPLNEPAVVDRLAAWSLPHRRFTVIARRFDEIERRHPRWVAWRRLRSDLVDCRTPESGVVAPLPTLLVLHPPPHGAQGSARVVRLRSAMPYRGSASGARADVVQAMEQLDALSQRSGPAFPATILGL